MNIQRILVSLLLLISAENYCQEFSTLGEIYDFEVGDEFQILSWEYDLYNPDTVYLLEIRIVHQKEIDLNKISYTQFITQYNLLNNTFPPFELAQIANFVDILVIHNPDSIIFSDDSSDTSYTNASLYNGRKICAASRFSTNYFSSYKYADGCGLVNFFGLSTMQMLTSKDSLLYFRKGEETWGSDAILGTQEYVNPPSNLFLYPNPVFSNLIIEIENQTPVEAFELKIYDSSGKQVIQTKFYKKIFSLDCSKLNSGLYFIKIKSGKDQMTSKFIKR